MAAAFCPPLVWTRPIPITFNQLLVNNRMKAIWNGAILAESDNTVVVEYNHYFPVESLHKEYFLESPHHTTCPWKGLASYYTLKVGSQTNENAAWYYPSPKEAAEHIRGRVAFWKGVVLEP